MENQGRQRSRKPGMKEGFERQERKSPSCFPSLPASRLLGGLQGEIQRLVQIKRPDEADDLGVVRGRNQLRIAKQCKEILSLHSLRNLGIILQRDDLRMRRERPYVRVIAEARETVGIRSHFADLPEQAVDVRWNW